MLSLIFNKLIDIVLLSYHLPFILVIVNFIRNKSNSRFELLLFVFISYSAILVLFEQFILFGYINNFNPIYNIQTIVDTTFILLIIATSIQNQKIFKVSFVTIVLFCLFTFYEIFYLRDIYSINYLSNSISKFLISIYCIIAIYQYETYHISENNFGKKMIIYIFLLFSLFSLTIALLEEIIRSDNNSLLEKIWMIQIILVLLYNLTMSYALWILRK